MSKPIKLIISSKGNLNTKYKGKFRQIQKILSDLKVSDRKKNLDTRVVYIDDKNSSANAGIKHVNVINQESCKEKFDELYFRFQPAYMVILGAQDVFPFQELSNPVVDFDDFVPTDLPYACESSYSKNISDFTGPTRVVGRIPDIPGCSDIKYLKNVIQSIIDHKPLKRQLLSDYFSLSAAQWIGSTQLSLTEIFGNSANLKSSPPCQTGHTHNDLKPIIHFFNCHGRPLDSRFFGQRGNRIPTALDSKELDGRIQNGTIVASECCFGAALYNPMDVDNNLMSIANTYFKNNCVAFLGSSNLSYGPPDGQGLADRITQYFVISFLNGASTGRAMLEARQRFIATSGDMEPFELKTLAQFYLLGDPSIQPIIEEVIKSGMDTMENRRRNLEKRGLRLSSSVMAYERSEKKRKNPRLTSDMKDVFRRHGFSGREKEHVYKMDLKGLKIHLIGENKFGDGGISFRTIIKEENESYKGSRIKVIVIKEQRGKTLGWRYYEVKSDV